MALVLELPAELETALHERARKCGVSAEALVLEYLRKFLLEEQIKADSEILWIQNIAAIKERGGYLCGDDDFQLVCCDLCGCRYLYNAEILRIFLDPADLTRVVLNIKGAEWPPCRCCGALDWNI